MDYTTLPTVKEGTRGDAVGVVQRALNAWLAHNRTGDRPLDVDDDFGPTTRCYVRAFQTRHRDSRGVELLVDGVVGRESWFALAAYSSEIEVSTETMAVVTVDDQPAIEATATLPTDLDGVSPLALAALERAIGEVGVCEEGPNRGARVEEYQRGPHAKNPNPGDPWCASFVSWCHWQGAGERATDMRFPYTASSRKIEASLSDRGAFTRLATMDDFLAMRPGDVLVWFRCGELDDAYGHIGFVHHVDAEAPALYTIEGNKLDRVAARRYAIDPARAQRLVRGLLGYGRVA